MTSECARCQSRDALLAAIAAGDDDEVTRLIGRPLFKFTPLPPRCQQCGTEKVAMGDLVACPSCSTTLGDPTP